MAEDVVLHRCPVPTDWLCPCGRVARELKGRGIDFDQVVEPLRRSRRDSIEEISGQRVLPVLEIDGEALCDSRRILERLALEAPSDGSDGSEPTAARPDGDRPD